MELRELRIFLALAEELHFTRAAARLHVAQPVVSSVVRAMEKRLGADLFVRTTRQVDLTPAGVMLLGHARAVLAAADALDDAMRSHRDGKEGTLRLGVLGVGAGLLTVPMLQAFSERHPRARLMLAHAQTTDLVQPLLDGRLDALLLWGPVEDPRLDRTPLLTEPRVAVLSQRDERAAAGSLTVGDLLDMRHAQRLPGEPERWDDFWNLVPERGGEQPDRVELYQTGDVTSQIRSIGLNGALLTMPASARASLPAAVLGVTYASVVDLTPATLSLVTARDTRNPLVAALRRVARQACERLIGLVPGAVAVPLGADVLS